MSSNDISSLTEALASRIIILDGAMGTMIQRLGLKEDDFHAPELPAENILRGCNDVLCLSRPDLIEMIHREYLAAGSRIISTNSFNANAISLADYGISHLAGAISKAAAMIARRAVDASGETAWVAGSMGPTSKSLAMRGSLDGSAESEPLTFDAMSEAYFEQASGLIAGGVDILLIETVYDGLNAKAAIFGARRAMAEAGRDVPFIISATLTESGRTLAGQTLDALFATIAHARPLAFGLNCSFGAGEMMRYVEELAAKSPVAVSVYPNAGLPNALGAYDQTPEMMAEALRPMISGGMVNIVGGCCGTTPEHIAAIAAEASGVAPRPLPDPTALASYSPLLLAGLELLAPRDFYRVGERCNVAGSRKFLRLIKEGAMDEAVSVAASQIIAGADIIDVNMDDAMIDAPRALASFLSRTATEPDVARVPVMIDSSNFEAVKAALGTVQGRPVVNSISLKEGEAAFLDHARYIAEMGAAMVVMAFDERGQADSYERKIEVAGRAFRLLTSAGISPSDIIFDPNILAVATGIESHAAYGLDFIRAAAWIRTNCPGAHVSGGLSNLSFSFRGNNYVREAIHSVFLSLARPEGMDMAIINPSTMMRVDNIPSDLREGITDVLLNRRADATDRLIALAAEAQPSGAAPKSKPADTAASLPSQTPSARLAAMVEGGMTDGLEGVVMAALDEVGSPYGVVDGPLMTGMNRVGERFGRGEMFLPQVVKSARTMKMAVAILTPLIEASHRDEPAAERPRMVIATVKGDVHDIGKNIVAVVMNCNGFDVDDLGVMVEAQAIVDRAEAERADFVGLSGLITPSLEEMTVVARLMEERGMTIPLFVGGATTSDIHTAVKIAPCYSGPVVHTRDAASLPGIARRFVDPATRPEAEVELRARQEEIRREYEEGLRRARRLSVEESRRRAQPVTAPSPFPVAGYGTHDIHYTISELKGIINRRAFFSLWHLDPVLDRRLTEAGAACGCPGCASDPHLREAAKLWNDALAMMDSFSREGITIAARAVLAAARTDRGSDTIIITDPSGSEIPLPTPRQTADIPVTLALSDFIAEADDTICLFCATAAGPLAEKIASLRASGDEYGAMLAESLADRLVEAATARLHADVATRLWGFASPSEAIDIEGDGSAQMGIRPAIGYPSLPDQRLVFTANRLIDYPSLGIGLTENGALNPSATTTGLILAAPSARYFSVKS